MLNIVCDVLSFTLTVVSRWLGLVTPLLSLQQIQWTQDNMRKKQSPEYLSKMAEIQMEILEMKMLICN